MALLQLLDGGLEPGVGAGSDLDDLAPERGEHVAVARVARPRDRHPVAHVERREERQQEAAARAGGHHDVVGGHVDPVAAAVVVGDRRPQLDDPDRRRVAERVARAEQADRLGVDRRRCAGARLARQQVDQVAVGALPLGRQRQQVHHVERRHVGAVGRGQAIRHDRNLTVVGRARRPGATSRWGSLRSRGRKMRRVGYRASLRSRASVAVACLLAAAPARRPKKEPSPSWVPEQ